MTALLILENIEDLNEVITFTDVIIPDLEPGNSTIDAKVGEQLTVEPVSYTHLDVYKRQAFKNSQKQYLHIKP